MPSSDSDDEPVLLGAQRVWFGKHQGDRFDTVLESYKAWATHPQRSQAPWASIFVNLYIIVELMVFPVWSLLEAAQGI